MEYKSRDNQNSVIKAALEKKDLNEKQYQLIKEAAGLFDVSDEKSGETELNFFQEVMQAYIQSELIKTQMQVNLIKSNMLSIPIIFLILLITMNIYQLKIRSILIV